MVNGGNKLVVVNVWYTLPTRFLGYVTTATSEVLLFLLIKTTTSTTSTVFAHSSSSITYMGLRTTTSSISTH